MTAGRAEAVVSPRAESAAAATMPAVTMPVATTSAEPESAETTSTGPASLGAAVIELTGAGWTVREALGMTWQWYVNAPAPSGGNNVGDAAEAATRSPGWIPATVPGSVIRDLVSAGEIDDPYRARKSRDAEWVSERSWVYRRSIRIPRPRDGDRLVLEIDGIDPGGSVFWNGELVGEVHGLYHRARIDLTGTLRDAGLKSGDLTAARRDAGADPAGPMQPAVLSGELAIVVEPSPDSEPQVGRTDRVRVHAPRMGYGWDFSPRMRHQGIWKGIRLVSAPVQLADLSARTELLEDGSGVVEIGALVEAPTRVRLEASLWHLDTVVATASVVAAPGAVRLSVAVPSPRLWWPNGFGEQSLYRLEVTAHSADDAAPGRSATAVRTVGFRTAVMVPNPEAPAGSLPYSAVVNGEAVPLLGWNWVPADTLYGTITRQRTDRLVALAADSGARLLRVWGGGLIETEEFYDACDRAGLLVWQEFSQSSSGMQSAPATDDAFVSHLRDEAQTVIPPLVHHPSLFMWGGGNELDDNGVPLDESRSPALAALRDFVARLDPGRHWVATSPTGPEFHNRLDRIRADPDGQHDVHGPWEHQGLVDHYTLYNSGRSLAHTEFGVEGMTTLRSLEALVPAELRWPTDRSNPVYRHLGEWWNNAELVRECFGGRIDTVEAMLRASQLLQATGLQYAIEADRRRAPRTSMVIPWQLHESYPNAWCTSSVDYRGDAKPAYHAVARAFRTERVSIRTERAVWAGEGKARATAWVWSERGVDASEVVLRLRDSDGTTVSEARRTLDGVSRPVEALALEVPLTGLSATGSEVFVWEAEWRAGDAVVDREVSLASAGADWSALLDLPPATLDLDVTVEPAAAGLASSGPAATGPAGSGPAITGPAGSGPTGSDSRLADNWLVRIRHLSGPLVVGLTLTDARAADSAGHSTISGDPRALLPGEDRTYRVHWDARIPLHERTLRLDAWNAGVHRIDAQISTSTSTMTETDAS